MSVFQGVVYSQSSKEWSGTEESAGMFNSSSVSSIVATLKWLYFLKQFDCTITAEMYILWSIGVWAYMWHQSQTCKHACTTFHLLIGMRAYQSKHFPLDPSSQQSSMASFHWSV